MTDQDRKPETAEPDAEPAEPNDGAQAAAENGQPASEAAEPSADVEEAPVVLGEDIGEPEGPSSEEQIARLTEENARLKDQAMRALAEAENTRRRAQRDKEDTAKFAVSSFAKDLLTVADNMGRALEAVPADGEADPVLVNLREGIVAVEREMMGAFDRNGITRIVPAGERFDPNYHQAMYEIEDSGQMPGTVVHVVQPGYVLHGRLLRPAMVGVAKGEPPRKVDTEA